MGGGGLQHFSVSPRPLGFGFLVLGLRVWGQGLTIKTWYTLIVSSHGFLEAMINPLSNKTSSGFQWITKVNILRKPRHCYRNVFFLADPMLGLNILQG